MAGGRPTTYTKDVLASAHGYIDGFKASADELVPTVVGLCRHIERSKSTVYNWQKDPDKHEFLDILGKIEENQNIMLVNGGLGGTLNPTITKMMLTKHGYSDKQEIDHTTLGESLNNAPSEAAIKKAREAILNGVNGAD